MGTLESELMFARSPLVLSLPRPDRAVSPQDCKSSTGLWGNLHVRVPPWSCRGSLTSMWIHGNGPVFPVGKSRFSHKAGAPASLPVELHKKGNPLWLLIKGCASPLLIWPERGLHPNVSEWVSNYNNYNLLELAIKGCLEICSSLQNVNTSLLILILNTQFTDCDLITYVNIPLESWLWANNLTWTVFPLNKVYPLLPSAIPQVEGKELFLSSEEANALLINSREWDITSRAVWQWGLHCKARVCQNKQRTKFPHSTRS